MPLADAFLGDRYGQLKDSCGHVWEVATHKKNISKKKLTGLQKMLLNKWKKKIKAILSIW
ncbi:MAG: hypothetical protein AB7U98_00520 [Candidatus Nitrosocosmicus sp.]